RHAAVLVHRARVRALPRGLRRKAAGRRYSPSGALAASPHPPRPTARPASAMHVITRLRSPAYVVIDESDLVCPEPSGKCPRCVGANDSECEALARSRLDGDLEARRAADGITKS